MIFVNIRNTNYKRYAKSGIYEYAVEILISETDAMVST